ncbi:hypothetical protein DIPPA_24644 [Diplonema papillatum]|nr:hypothetical protein DIPPA_24644 [Diplonema papillatum]
MGNAASVTEAEANAKAEATRMYVEYTATAADVELSDGLKLDDNAKEIAIADGPAGTKRCILGPKIEQQRHYEIRVDVSNVTFEAWDVALGVAPPDATAGSVEPSKLLLSRPNAKIATAKVHADLWDSASALRWSFDGALAADQETVPAGSRPCVLLTRKESAAPEAAQTLSVPITTSNPFDSAAPVTLAGTTPGASAVYTSHELPPGGAAAWLLRSRIAEAGDQCTVTLSGGKQGVAIAAGGVAKIDEAGACLPDPTPFDPETDRVCFEVAAGPPAKAAVFLCKTADGGNQAKTLLCEVAGGGAAAARAVLTIARGEAAAGKPIPSVTVEKVAPAAPAEPAKPAEKAETTEPKETSGEPPKAGGDPKEAHAGKAEESPAKAKPGDKAETTEQGAADEQPEPEEKAETTEAKQDAAKKAEDAKPEETPTAAEAKPDAGVPAANGDKAETTESKDEGEKPAAGAKEPAPPPAAADASAEPEHGKKRVSVVEARRKSSEVHPPAAEAHAGEGGTKRRSVQGPHQPPAGAEPSSSPQRHASVDHAAAAGKRKTSRTKSDPHASSPQKASTHHHHQHAPPPQASSSSSPQKAAAKPTDEPTHRRKSTSSAAGAEKRKSTDSSAAEKKDRKASVPAGEEPAKGKEEKERKDSVKSTGERKKSVERKASHSEAPKPSDSRKRSSTTGAKAEDTSAVRKTSKHENKPTTDRKTSKASNK